MTIMTLDSDEALYAFTSRILHLGLCPFLSFMIFFLVKAYRWH